MSDLQQSINKVGRSFTFSGCDVDYIDVDWSNIINVEDLDLSGNYIEDIEPIKVLTNLRVLTLDGNCIHSLSGLENLTNIYYLDLSSNMISDLKPLANLTNLTYLNLGDNKIESLEGLENLTKLSELHLSNNKIKSLIPIYGLENIYYLDIKKNQNHPFDLSFFSKRMRKSVLSLIADEELYTQVNLYRIINHHGKSRFQNYRQRLKIMNLKLFKINLRILINFYWEKFLCQKLNKDNLNRLCYLSQD